MSESEVSRLMIQVNEILLKLERMDEKLIGYPALIAKVDTLDKGLSEQTQKCKFVQDGKTKINWGGVIGTIIAGAILAVFSFVAGYILNK